MILPFGTAARMAENEGIKTMISESSPGKVRGDAFRQMAPIIDSRTPPLR
jgi:hypothetical protein